MKKLNAGDQAPVFSGVNQNDQKISLINIKGRKIILFFYPKDMTPGCTAEACNLRDNYKELKDRGFEIIGISADGKDSHKKFIGKYNLPFSLIADEDKKIINEYGIWVKKTRFGKSYEGIQRTTFIIDEQGNIEHIINKVDTKDHAGQILNLYDK